MSKKIKIMMMVTIMVVSLSATTLLVFFMPGCEYCGSKFCFGGCTIVYPGNNGPDGIMANAHNTNQSNTRLGETPRANMSYLDNITFIGDSRTVALGAYTEIDPSRILAEDGLNHETALTKRVIKIQEYKTVTIAEAVRIQAPTIMVINFGVNGIGWMNLEQFMESYEAFVDQMIESSPYSIIVVQAIMPISLRYEQSGNGVSNQKIEEANNALYELAKRKGLYYLAVDDVMKSKSNTLNLSFDSGDGLHYNQKAYDTIIDYILRHAIYKK